MGKITKLVRQKKRENRVSVFIDNSFAVGLTENEVIDFDLYQGKEISDKDLRIIRDSSQIEKIKDKALRLISIRPRSEAELREKLVAKKYDTKQIERTISFLRKEKLLDDKKFAKMWIYHRIEFSNYGKRRIAAELWKKKVSENIISKETGKISSKEEFTRAREIGIKKWNLLKEDTAVKKKEKLIGFLSRKGYSWDIILKVLDSLKG